MNIRTYIPEFDRDDILSLSKRLADFATPARIDDEVFKQVKVDLMRKALNELAPDSLILVARDSNSADSREGALMGFIELVVKDDWTAGDAGKQKRGHVERIVLAKEAEGKGLAKEFMMRAETWARENDFTSITLNVFVDNERALGFYQYLGYEFEIAEMVKVL